MSSESPRAKRTQLDPQAVESLIRYGMGELEKAGMVFAGQRGGVVTARISPAKLASKARDTIRAFPFSFAERFATYIEGVVQSEHNSYQKARRISAQMGRPAG